MSGLFASSALALVSAGGGFFYQSPSPFAGGYQTFGGAIDSFCIADADNLWLVNSNYCGSRLYHSPDGGESWRSVDASLLTTDLLGGLTFVGDQHARGVVHHLGTDDLDLLRSDDGGRTWSQSRLTPGDVEPWGIRYPSPEELVVFGRQASPSGDGQGPMLMLVSADGGASWRRHPLPVQSALDLRPTDLGHYWLIGSEGGSSLAAYVSADGGATWARRTLPAGAIQVDSLTLFDAQHAFIRITRKAKPYNVYYSTADGGEHWRKVAAVPAGGTGMLSPLGPDEAWLTVTDDRRDRTSYLKHTADGGATWTTRYVGQWGVNGVQRGPDGTLWGDAGAYRSTDGGVTWQQVRGGYTDYWLLDVAAASDGALWATGGATPGAWLNVGPPTGGGLLYRCTDGARWRAVDIPASKALGAIDTVGSSVLWVVRAGDTVIRSTDVGATWKSSSLGKGNSGFDIVALDDSTAVMLAYQEGSDAYAVLRTSDGGAHWARVARSTTREELNVISRLSDNELLVAGRSYTSEQGMLWRSTDGGATWGKSTFPCDRWIRDMTFVDADHGWIVANDMPGAPYIPGVTTTGAIVLRTSDGGRTWQTADLSNEIELTAVTFADAWHGWVLGTRILETWDGGGAWADSGAAVPDLSISFRGGSTIRAATTHGGDLWAVGAEELIMSTADTAADTAPPMTTDDGDRRWHNTSVTVRLTAVDPGGSVLRTEYCLGGGWRPAGDGTVTLRAPKNHSGDGVHAIKYRSVDAAGNVEFPRTCTVRIDTRRPRTRATAVSVRRGKRVTLPFRITDAKPNGGTAKVRIVVRRAGGRVVKRLPPVNRRVNKRVKVGFRCTLRPGRYTWWAPAVDTAGNPQASALKGTLIVRP